MANIKSAKKRILVNRTKAARNKSIKSAVKTSIKKVEAAVASKDKAAAEVALKDAVSTISKATSKDVNYKLIIKRTAITVMWLSFLFVFFNLQYLLYCYI